MSFSLAELVFILVNIVSPVMAIAAIGFFLARQFSLDSRVLSKLSLYLFSPTLTFVSIYRSKLGTEFASIIFFAVVIFLAMGIISWIISKSLRYDRLTTSAFALFRPRSQVLIMTRDSGPTWSKVIQRGGRAFQCQSAVSVKSADAPCDPQMNADGHR